MSISKGPTRWEWMQTVLSADGPTGQKGHRHDFDSVTAQAVRLALCALGQHMDPSGGSCFPSIPLLAVETSLGERTIRRALQWAVEEGWVDREPRGRGYIYRPLIPAALAGVHENGKRPPWPESETEEGGSTPAALAGVPIPAALATVAARASDTGRPGTGHRPPWPPSSISEVAREEVSSPVYSTLPPILQSEQRREDVAHVDREIRLALRNECLLGENEGTLPDGTHVTLGLLVTQWREDLAPFFERELLLGMLRLVRSDEDAPQAHECFTLRWFEPERLSRLEGLARRESFPRTLDVARLVKPMPHARPEDLERP